MSATLQQECYAALWSALFRATHSLDRYIEVDDVQAGRLLPPTRPHVPVLDPQGPLATQSASLMADQPAPPRRDAMFPHIERDPQYHWIPRSELIPTRDSAYETLRRARGAPGFHQGEVVPEGQMFRVNHLYRFPRVQYPAPAQETQ